MNTFFFHVSNDAGNHSVFMSQKSDAEDRIQPKVYMSHGERDQNVGKTRLQLPSKLR